MMKEITRRELLLSLPAFAMAPRLFAQGDKPAIPVRALNQITLLVSDVKRSVDFYQGLFGMPIQARQGSTIVLRIGNGPQFMSISPAGSAPPSIVQMGISIANFNADRIVSVLTQHGFTKSDSVGPMKVHLSE